MAQARRGANAPPRKGLGIYEPETFAECVETLEIWGGFVRSRVPVSTRLAIALLDNLAEVLSKVHHLDARGGGTFRVSFTNLTTEHGEVKMKVPDSATSLGGRHY